MTVLPPIEKRQTPKTQGVRFVGFHYKLYRYMTAYDDKGDNGVDGERDYRKGLRLTHAQANAIDKIGSGEFALRVDQDGTVTFTTLDALQL